MNEEYIPGQLTREEIDAMMIAMAGGDEWDAFMNVYDSYRKTP